VIEILTELDGMIKTILIRVWPYGTHLGSKACHPNIYHVDNLVFSAARMGAIQLQLIVKERLKQTYNLFRTLFFISLIHEQEED
jgi:hypothetical protein